MADNRSWYNPRWHYDNEPDTRAALDLINSNHFSPKEPGTCAPIWERLITAGDFYMHLADLTAYTQTQAQVSALYADRTAWTSGKFSSDRTISEYAAHIWNTQPCPVP